MSPHHKRFIALTTKAVLVTVLLCALGLAIGLTLYRTSSAQLQGTAVTSALAMRPTGTPIYTEDTPDLLKLPSPRHSIPWEFTTHAAPDFYSDIIGVFAPQRVVILEEQNGWAKIYGTHGESWVYIASDRIFLPRVMGLFDQPHGERVSRLNPQVVDVLQRQNRWVEIPTYRGNMWLDLDFQPPIYELEAFVGQFGNTLSVFYENMASGFIFYHNADRVYFGASATKLPFGLYIYLKAEAGETNMNTLVTYTAADFWEGSGIIRHRYVYGTTFTQRRLLNLMLTPSDNIATRMLRRLHGLNGYRAWVESIGANPDFVQNLTYSYLTAHDAGIFIRETYRYIHSGGRYSLDLRDNMLANRYPFVTSDYPVASKSGWAATFGAAWHDMAIVFAPSPYTLVLMSARAGNAADRNVYNQISMFVQEFNSTWFYP